MLVTQPPPFNPPHNTSTPSDTITIKDVPENSSQNINPLTIEYRRKILDQSTLQAQLCDNPILVSVDKLQKVVVDLRKDNVSP